jgi:hypothetical protein
LRAGVGARRKTTSLVLGALMALRKHSACTTTRYLVNII